MVLEEPPAPAARVEVGRAAAGARRLFHFDGQALSYKSNCGLDIVGQGWMRVITAKYRLQSA